MPIYEYQCQACGVRTEVLQRFADPPLSECPQCGGSMRKLVSAPAIQFKGSGWYVTDYAAKGGASSAGGEGKSGQSEGGADSKSEPKSESKSDSKSDTKTESKGEGPAAGASTSPKSESTAGSSGASGSTSAKPTP